LAPPFTPLRLRASTVTNGNPATFSVTARAAPPLRFQWRFNGGELNGQTNSTLTIANAQPVNAGNYVVRITTRSARSIARWLR